MVELDRAAAEADVLGPERALEPMDAVADRLDAYPYLHAAGADMLRRPERVYEARSAYARALELSGNASEWRFLEQRLAQLDRTLDASHDP